MFLPPPHRIAAVTAFALFAVIAACFALLPANAHSPPIADHERLQGAWKARREEYRGKPSSHLDLRLTFTKDRVEYQTSMVLHDGTFRLDSTAKPKQMDIKTDAWLMHALYRFDGDTLVLAAGPSLDTERPKDFAAAKRNKFVWTMERVPIASKTPPPDAWATQAARMARARLRCGGRLERLVRAMHRYHDDHGRFPPPALTDRSGKPLLSWRVELLPYLDEKELYEQFRIDEPWNSRHNRMLLAKIPTAYAPVGRPPQVAHGTFYQVFVGKNCLFEVGKQITFEDVTDGTVNTIAVIAPAEAVPWTKPTDLAYAADKPLPSFTGGMIADGLISFATADSGVHMIPNAFGEAKEQLFRLAITRNDGVPIELTKLQK